MIACNPQSIRNAQSEIRNTRFDVGWLLGCQQLDRFWRPLSPSERGRRPRAEKRSSV